jgi:predicted Zn-dependent peptidase
MKEQRLFSDVNAYISGDVDPGLLTLTGRLMPGVTMQVAEDALWKQLTNITEKGVTAYELEKVKNKIVSNLVFSEISFLNKAMNMAQYELLGDVNEVNKETEHYNAVTLEQIKVVANKVFRRENSSTLYYLTNKK